MAINVKLSQGAQKLLETLPIRNDDPNPGGVVVARGQAELNEFFLSHGVNRGGRPRAEDPRVNVSIRIPKSYATKLRESGPGWQTRMGDFLTRGVDRGDKRLLSASA